MPIGTAAGEFLEAAATRADATTDDSASDFVTTVNDLIRIVVDRWQTAEDERVCPECGPLDGIEFDEGTGPYPPLHNNCRCERVFWRIELVTRDAT